MITIFNKIKWVKKKNLRAVAEVTVIGLDFGIQNQVYKMLKPLNYNKLLIVKIKISQNKNIANNINNKTKNLIHIRFKIKWWS